MSADHTSTYRRNFLKKLAVTSASIPLLSLVAIPKLAFSGEKVADDDPVAASLNYVHDASTSEARTDESSVCENCQLYTAGEDGWGACSIFQGKLVNANGWCSAWIAKS